LAPKSIITIAMGADVAFVDIVDPTPVVEFNIIWRRTDTSPILQAFLATVREVARSRP
ncbi:MAG: hypothetical protein H0U76_01375, partial [Ktedonobacteraceae bacterium]|nr:hypothetical protein [Ktedonobacteraceae bacterium]